uniref:RFX-type winged-helix domain-containing protein n=1 Tax=Glossina morsitans morsitans TaxID=37546 RepID=A0A1B0FKB6_GLOMM
MHSRLTLEQQQQLHHHLQQLNCGTSFNHLLDKCHCKIHTTANCHHSNRHHHQQYHYQQLTHPSTQQQQSQHSLNQYQNFSASSYQSTPPSVNQHHAIAHHLHHHHHHHHHHQTFVATAANYTSTCTAAIACSPSPSSSSASPNPSTTASTAMYRRQNNLSYCGVSAQDAGQNYQVQYVDTELYHSNSSQTQMTYPFCPVGDYQSNGQSYYTTTTAGNYASTASLNTPTAHTPSALPYLVPVDESLLLNSSSQSHSRDSPHSLTEVAYLHEAQGAPQTPTSTTTTNSLGGGSVSASNSNSVGGGADIKSENENHLGNTNKIATATIKWLSRNYETADGVSLPRSTLYNHYIQHCNESKLEPVNAASFGKLIRSVFSGLRTRRLGTRGNSKYHYYGIRIKPDSILNQITEEKTSFTMHGSGSSNSTGNASLSAGVSNSNITCSIHGASNTGNIGMGGSHTNKTSRKHILKPETYEACVQFLGDGSGAVPSLPVIDLGNSFGSELTAEDADIFRSMYREHCENFLDAILNLEFHTIEFLWRDFWRDTSDNGSSLDECGEEKYLSKTKLYLLCHCAGVQKFVREVDYQFYQNMVDVIIPDVLRSIPNALTQAIRNFAKNMEIWLCECMLGVPERMIQIKSTAVSAFCQTLRRYTSLNHLAQAARAVLQNSTQIAQMLSDLNRVDFHNVQEQAAWVCQCEPTVVQRLENDFKAALQQQSSLEQWASWLQLVVDSTLQEYHGKPNYAKAARQFLLKWSFYSSMVIRDLTLRSASSFGSFHLIRLLYDEYMFYLVEHKIAEEQQKTAIAVICDRVKKDVDFDFEYQLEFITSSNVSSEQASKRVKHE